MKNNNREYKWIDYVGKINSKMLVDVINGVVKQLKIRSN